MNQSRGPSAARAQRGMSLIGLLAWAIIIGFIGYVAVRVLPTVNEYLTIQRAVDRVAAESPATVAEVRRALALITDSDDRDQWLKIGMALHAEFAGSDEGFDLWSHWSRQSLKFDERDQSQKWKSFRRSGVGIGTLFEIAKN